MYGKLIILAASCIFSSLFGAACSDNPPRKDPEPVLPPVEVSRLVTEKNKTYVSVDGKPFSFLGAQIRLDALLNCDEMSWKETRSPTSFRPIYLRNLPNGLAAMTKGISGITTAINIR